MPKGRQQPTLREHVDRGALLGQQHGSRSASDTNVHAEAHAARAAGERRHRRHALEDRLAAHQPVGLPQRVDAPASQRSTQRQ
jgi:hypothetical protein